MIENARRQVFLVLLVTVLSLVFALKERPSLGLDLSGGTQLIYEVNIAEARARNQIDPNMTDDQVMDETVRILADRIDPTGTREPVIARRGDNQILIELPDVGETEAEIIRRQIETLGRLEMRLVATPTYRNGDVQFDLPKEKERLQEWLAEADHRAMVAKDPERIDDFNTLPIGRGRLSEKLQWYPAKIHESYKQAGAWDIPGSRDPDKFVVAAFTPEQHATPPPPITDPDDKPFLVELYPINMDALHFTGEQMNASGVRAGTDPESGGAAVFYELNAEYKTPYGQWSEENIGEQSAIILNGIVHSAPVFQSRIPGSGIIRGSFTNQEATDLAKVIKTGSLQVKPQPVSSLSIGATLGQRSIRLGMFSVAAGAFAVLVFCLAYYRLSGLVAFAAIALNVLMICGVVQFIRATITLPGIAGIALTMGMAVDSNILVYERIREELAKGKELLQAVRVGFERAWVTILDANLTTFLAGVVLYNVGVGPVRGFAVTLMVGILTTLFTAFFVTRLMFHYLLEYKILREFKAASWFTGVKFDFIRAGPRAIAVSLLVIGLGLGYAATIPLDKSLSLDFTGGASLTVSLAEPLTESELRQRLDQDAEFAAQYPRPQITRLSDAELVGDKSNRFSIKLKLTEQQRQELDRLQREAEAKGEPFEPPFKRQVLSNPNLPFVPKAFTAVGKVLDPDTIGMYIATADVNFGSPVEVAKVEAALKEKVARGATAQAFEAGQDASQKIAVEFPVGASDTEGMIQDKIAEGLHGLTDTSGQPVVLSNPIPSAEEIGSRMVGELRTAAIGAMVLAMFLIVMFIRLRFHEYKYGVAGVVALVHDVLVTFVFVVVFNGLGLVDAELGLSMIAAFLTIVGFSINDTIVIFDRVRENVAEQKRLGDTKESFAALLNRSINQTLSRTILTSGITLFVVIAMFVVNKGQGSDLEGFSFALLVGFISGVYSTVFIASPIVLWMRNRELRRSAPELVAKAQESVAVKSSV